MSAIGKLLRISSENALLHKQSSISFSQYSLWAQCPLHWKLRYIDKIKIQEPSIILVFGTSIHETVQHYIRTMFDSSIKKANQINLTELLAEQMINNYANQLISNNNVHFSTKDEMDEFLTDGSAILDYLAKNRSKYFSNQGYELVGIEVPICTPASKYNVNVYFLGYVDLILYDKDLDKIIVYDFKSSMRGWKDKDKKDDIKKRQLIFYKNYISELTGYEPDKIDVIFMILKRKVFMYNDLPTPRIQQFKPTSGPRIRKVAQQEIDKFIISCFNPDGTYNTNQEYPAIKGINNEHCKYCEFKNRFDLCPKEKRLTAQLPTIKK